MNRPRKLRIGARKVIYEHGILALGPDKSAWRGLVYLARGSADILPRGRTCVDQATGRRACRDLGRHVGAVAPCGEGGIVAAVREKIRAPGRRPVRARPRRVLADQPGLRFSGRAGRVHPVSPRRRGAAAQLIQAPAAPPDPRPPAHPRPRVPPTPPEWKWSPASRGRPWRRGSHRESIPLVGISTFTNVRDSSTACFATVPARRGPVVGGRRDGDRQSLTQGHTNVVSTFVGKPSAYPDAAVCEDPSRET